MTERVDISNRLAVVISKNCNSNNYSTKFQKYQAKTEKKPLDFTNTTCNYNLHFTITELRVALKKSLNTASGPVENHYQLLQRLPRDSLIALLDMFDVIRTSGEIPECWKEATVIPFPEPGKAPKAGTIID